jgi:hypothetical protein
MNKRQISQSCEKSALDLPHLQVRFNRRRISLCSELLSIMPGPPTILTRIPVFASVMIPGFVLFLASPVSPDPPNLWKIRGKQAQELLTPLRERLSIQNEIHIVVVPHHPLVFSVEPVDRTRQRFVLSMELGFLVTLDEDELRAALAHELGHVWIYTHHPFLQTERQANEIGLRAEDRQAFERLYRKLWRYEGAAGVSLDELLGPPPE